MHCCACSYGAWTNLWSAAKGSALIDAMKASRIHSQFLIVAAGFDTVNAIATKHVSTSPKNSMQDFINRKYPNTQSSLLLPLLPHWSFHLAIDDSLSLLWRKWKGLVKRIGHMIENDEVQTAQQSILTDDHTPTRLVTAQHSSSLLSIIHHLLNNQCSKNIRSSAPSTGVISIDHESTGPCSPPSRTEECWIRCGGIIFTKKDLQLITGGKELTDKHVNAYQSIMKHQFPSMGGFQNTLLFFVTVGCQTMGRKWFAECDKCDEWFHVHCVSTSPIDPQDSWYWRNWKANWSFPLYNDTVNFIVFACL